MTCDPLELEIQPPYIGSAVSPTVDITETETDITVNITDFRGDHSYTVEKTDQAIADAETAATNANNAAANATSTANQAAQYARTTADQAAADAQETADEAAGRADTAAGNATSAAQSANTAAGNATAAAGAANTAAGNADAKAQLADTAAANADTATQAANTATTNATNAAQAANNAADYAIEAADDMPKLIATVDTAQTVSDAWPTTIHGATLYGKCVQDGTPTPDAPVEVQVVQSPNKLDVGTSFEDWGCAENNGLKWRTGSINNYVTGTIDRDTGSITIETYNTSGWFWAAKEIELEPNTGYYLSSTAVGVKIVGFNELSDYSQGTLIKSGAGAFNSGSYAYRAIVFYPNGFATIGLQVERGTTATPYAPYGCAALYIDDGIIPIDLQGHTLASLPDGTRDVLRVDSAGRVWIEQNVGHDTQTTPIAARTDTNGKNAWTFTLDNALIGVASNVLPNLISDQYTRAKRDNMLGVSKIDNSIGIVATAGAVGKGQAICVYNPQVVTASLSDAVTYFAAHPFEVYYQLATPQTIELGTIELPELTNPCELAVYASLDPEWAIQYEQDPNIVVNALQSSIAPVEGSTASTNYAVNSYLIHDNQLYRVTSAIATGEAITPGSNCVSCTVMGEVIRLTA